MTFDGRADRTAPSGRDLRPLAVAVVTAVISLALVVASARWGWLGPDVGRGDGFCEAARPGWVRQPANTWSNLGFVIAGLAIAWDAGERARLGVTLGAHPGLATAYAVIVVLLGPGSMAMHATQTDLGGHLDLLSMYLVSGFALAYALMRFVHRGPAFLAVVFTVAVVAGMAVHLRGGSVPVLGHAGNAAFGVEVLVALGLEVALYRRRSPAPRQDLRFGVASVATLALAFAIWTTGMRDHPWCQPGHAAAAARHLARALRGVGLPDLPALRRRAGRHAPGCRGPRPPEVSGVVSTVQAVDGQAVAGRSSGSISPEMSRSRRSTPVIRWKVAPAMAAPRIGASQKTHSAHRPVAVEERDAGGAGRVDRRVRDRDRDEVDEGEHQTDGDRGEALRRTGVRGAEDDVEEHRGEQHLGDDHREQVVPTGGVIAVPVRRHVAGGLEARAPPGDDEQGQPGEEAAGDLGDRRRPARPSTRSASRWRRRW